MPDMNVVDDHFDRELGASGAARCGMLVTAMLMIMQKRLPGPNGQSGTWLRSIVMKGCRRRAGRPVGAAGAVLDTSVRIRNPGPVQGKKGPSETYLCPALPLCSFECPVKG
jgi:hypothetical protein